MKLQALKWLKLEERKHRCNMLVKHRDPAPINWHYDEMKEPYNVTIDCCMEYRAQGAPVISNTGRVKLFMHALPYHAKNQ